MIKIFLIDFSHNNNFVELFPKNIEITIEKKDGGNAYKLIGEQIPDAIFINIESKISHCIKTAIPIKKRIKTANIPIYFVGQNIEFNQTLNEIGIQIESKDIITAISTL